ncbi:MAG: hypothetical protein ABJN26_06055 [Stappiaceae bacterium]
MDKAAASKTFESMKLVLRELDESIVQIQDDCDEEEYRNYKYSVGKVMVSVRENILDPIFKEYPELIPEELK